MLSRILWRVTTPRALRRRALILLLAWLLVALAYQDGYLGDVPAERLPVAVPASAG